ncbi:DUF982 domain-containing protein [Shinella yambaruensis]|uniref:DUF982 domain-containing protein n=1 Tax=Shinella yambaruensis TaxID=415996 RepID=A0ABQ5ZQG1_9HYPH|nr:DUF982 domain-containing protein [Shinella yambaruensis]MCJ8028795.1 DUF982 domain-containing protein [Shinella yambaruensis]MCU7981851.1 DUF982 domain-containing protein [Shinella yambaruensis]GLR54893.1 hypothetical protein GCM10007923_61120 [Shinella yambaruensis]
MLADVFFSTPLHVHLSNGLGRTFDSVNDTLDFLENEWPLRHGQRYKRACEKCRAALLRQVPVAVAREAFVAACLEAGLPVQAMPPVWQRSGPSTPPRMSA